VSSSASHYFRKDAPCKRGNPTPANNARCFNRAGRAVFRPEVALLLASLKRSSITELPLDLDLELLDLDLVVRLAERLRVLPLWQAWYEKAKAANFGAE
jgi:hypothetical protein